MSRSRVDEIFDEKRVAAGAAATALHFSQHSRERGRRGALGTQYRRRPFRKGLRRRPTSDAILASAFLHILRYHSHPTLAARVRVFARQPG
eukprot:1757890-Pleurochrysis_carterae.AAC.1